MAKKKKSKEENGLCRHQYILCDTTMCSNPSMTVRLLSLVSFPPSKITLISEVVLLFAQG
jgi:hypothetical protein